MQVVVRPPFPLVTHREFPGKMEKQGFDTVTARWHRRSLGYECFLIL